MISRTLTTISISPGSIDIAELESFCGAVILLRLAIKALTIALTGSESRSLVLLDLWRLSFSTLNYIHVIQSLIILTARPI